jgi:zeta-carotene desaturase
MPSVIVIGGGLAGLATAAALGKAGFQVDLFEARGFLGGRATSYPLAGSEDGSEIIDNCQHVLLRCCVNLMDFYRRLGVADRIKFYKEFYFIEPGGRTSVLRAGCWPSGVSASGVLTWIRSRCSTGSGRSANPKPPSAASGTRFW